MEKDGNKIKNPRTKFQVPNKLESNKKRKSKLGLKGLLKVLVF